VFNGLVKVPMQALILFVGVLLFVFYVFHAPPVFFNAAAWQKAHAAQPAAAGAIDADWSSAVAARRTGVEELVGALSSSDDGAVDAARTHLRQAGARTEEVRKRARSLIAATQPRAELKDADYVFISFVVAHFPTGLVGLLLAVILCAAMSATAAALTSLGSTTVIDFYKPTFRPTAPDAHYLAAARWFTVGWGALAVAFAAFASQLDNLIQAVNILGSIFYGPMLGVFLVGFFLRRVGGTAAFFATLVAQAIVVAVFAATSIGFLWYNVIGCAAVVIFGLALEVLLRRRR
jgi:Na+(H+)/acetate symporter ActP